MVEDDDLTRAFLLDNLAADGFGVAGASRVAERLRAIEVRQPALVVRMLEDGSGLALLDRVRAADGLASRIDPDLPVIVLSGRVGDADRVRSFARGADDHLNKPTCRFRSMGSRTWRGLRSDDCADSERTGLRAARTRGRQSAVPPPNGRTRSTVIHPAFVLGRSSPAGGCRHLPRPAPSADHCKSAPITAASRVTA